MKVACFSLKAQYDSNNYDGICKHTVCVLRDILFPSSLTNEVLSQIKCYKQNVEIYTEINI